MATPHIESKKESIAKKVLMPGDPMRAKYIAEHYLEDVELVNDVRGMLAYTGNYKGSRVTVFASGMGIPSIAIYAYELFQFYEVEEIIRIGSCGAYTKDISLGDLVLVKDSVSESTFGKVFCGSREECISSDNALNEKILEAASSLNQHITPGNIYCSEAFYTENKEKSKLPEKYHCLGVEMETFALFHIAKTLGKKASAILTVSDSFVTNEKMTSEMREKGLHDMIEVALTTII